MALELVNELLEVARRRRRLFSRDQAVEHQQTDVLSPDLAPQKCDQPLESFVFQHPKRADVEQALRDDAFVEERHRPKMLQHSAMRFGEQRDIDASAAVRHMPVTDLVRQNRFARSRYALDDVHAGGEQSALSDRIEPIDSSRESLQR